MRANRSWHALVTAMVLAATSACGLFDGAPDPEQVVQAFVQGLRSGSVEPATLTDAGDAEAAQRLLADMSEELGTPPQFPLAGPVVAEEPQDEAGGQRQAATARLRVRWRLPTGTWAYDSALALRLNDGEWKVAWSPTVLHPSLAEGQSLRVLWTAPERGPILSAAGEPLFKPLPVVTVYVQPRRTRDLDDVLTVLNDTLQIESAPLRERVVAADPDHLVDAVTLRVEDYAPLRTTLQPVPGLVFRKSWRPLTPTREFGRALLGRVGPPTAEVLDAAAPGFGPTDLLGLSGLQRQFQHRLAGRPGLRVVTVDADGDEVATLHEAAPVPGEALRTTLDPQIQAAADEALSTVEQTSALVAIRHSSGEVLAVANGPDGGEVNLALTGRYALGWTFEMIATTGLVDAGLDRDAPVSRLPTEALAQASGQLGFGGDWTPGVDAFSGQVPEAVDPATGQREVQASPLLMASVAAAIADGTWRPPVLLPDHARPGDGPRNLEPETKAALADLMREPARGRGGRPVFARSATAGDGGPHAWALAYRGDLAVAVLVEGDSSARTSAASVVAQFFQRL